MMINILVDPFPHSTNPEQFTFWMPRLPTEIWYIHVSIQGGGMEHVNEFDFALLLFFWDEIRKVTGYSFYLTKHASPFSKGTSWYINPPVDFILTTHPGALPYPRGPTSSTGSAGFTWPTATLFPRPPTGGFAAATTTSPRFPQPPKNDRLGRGSAFYPLA